VKAHAKTEEQISFLMPGLREQLDPRQELYRLAEAMPWEVFEKEMGGYYSEEGRPAKPVRLMVGLLLLKQMYDLGDETAVAQWVQNPYWQFFCGECEFQWVMPCDPSDLVHFRHRIGEAGMALIFGSSVFLHGEKAQEKEVVIDSTVQEKNVTYPTDTKLHRKIIVRCWKAADRHGVKLRRRYGKEVRKCVLAQRGRRQARTRQAAVRAARKLKTIAGRLVRELERKLPEQAKAAEAENFALYRRVLAQQRHDSGKVYSLHEPHIYCVSKGKEHKKYEFGTKASLAMTKSSGIIVAAVAHEENEYDGHTLPEVLAWAEAFQGERPKVGIVDRGYRGARWVGDTEILTPDKGPKNQSKRERQAMKKRFRRRCAIEPVIGHLKSDYRLGRNCLRGFAGDQINLFLAAAAWNFRKWMRLSAAFWRLLPCLFQLVLSSLSSPALSTETNTCF
jgi:IS5 family transposase